MTINFEHFFKKLEGAYAPNTIRSYRSDFKHYADWCTKNQYEALPSSSKQVVRYLEELGKTLSTATIGRRIASLSNVFRLTQNEDVTKNPDAQLTYKKLRRKLGCVQKQASPLTLDILKRLSTACDSSTEGQRNRLLLRLGYETMRRRSELCSFMFEDLQMLPNGRHALLLRRSKTDQYGEGKLIPISDDLAMMIDKWSEHIQQHTGYILRGLYSNHTVRHKLNPSGVNKILRVIQERAGMTDNTLSGHSFRVGAAIDLLDKGIPIERIMLRGGWKSERTAMRYLRNWDDSDWVLFND